MSGIRMQSLCNIENLKVLAAKTTLTECDHVIYNKSAQLQSPIGFWVAIGYIYLHSHKWLYSIPRYNEMHGPNICTITAHALTVKTLTVTQWNLISPNSLMGCAVHSLATPTPNKFSAATDTLS